MQAATSPFSSSLPHPHYHGYYQIQPPGIELKRQYLSLLPPQQIIEICLTFDAYVPPYAKITIWPSDLNAAIAGLQKPSLSENSVPSETSDDGPDNVNSQRAQEPSTTQPDITGAVDPRPPDREDSSTPVPLPGSPSTESPIPVQKSTENPCSESPSDPPSGSAAEPAQSATTLTIQGQASQSLQTVQTTQPVPPQLYGYGHPQAAYPHTPYYPPGYPYPYVYPSPQHGFNPPPAYPPHQTPYGSMAPPPPPPHPLPEALGTDDLPSYEEMIVEALTESTDPEGSAPKDLFTWMAARYPLQSNFRPSASQALQKAFKRGRFEKSSNGKYRLNATWEGGNTSRRTTRRPQTQNHASSGPANRTSGSPFTHAPLVHHHQHHPPRVVASGQPPYPAHPYGYPGYPPYGSHQPHASTSKAPGANVEPASSVKNSTEGATSSGDSAAAYEAAQSILKAINFGGLLKLPPDEQNEQKQGASQSVGNGVEQLLSHVQAILAAENAEEATVGSSALSSGSSLLPSVPAVQASAETRAELQAQFALLSAQLAELAQTEQSEAMAPLPGSQPIMNSLVADHPDTSTNTTMTSNSTPPSALTTVGTSVEGGVESDEDDMEEII